SWLRESPLGDETLFVLRYRCGTRRAGGVVGWSACRTEVAVALPSSIGRLPRPRHRPLRRDSTLLHGLRRWAPSLHQHSASLSVARPGTRISPAWTQSCSSLAIRSLRVGGSPPRRTPRETPPLCRRCLRVCA